MPRYFTSESNGREFILKIYPENLFKTNLIHISVPQSSSAESFGQRQSAKMLGDSNHVLERAGKETCSGLFPRTIAPENMCCRSAGSLDSKLWACVSVTWRACWNRLLGPHVNFCFGRWGWGQRRGVPRWCWCCGPATTLGEALLRERTALPKNGCAGVGTRNRNTLQLSSISALHTLILLKHDFVYTFNLLKTSTLPSLLITVTTLNRKLQTIRDAPTFPLCSWRAGPFPGPQKILSLRLLHICSSCLYSLECILTLLILFAFQSPACSWRLS